MDNAIGYVRVSTQEQADTGVSLDAQEAAVRGYAALRGLALVAVVVDAGVSGGKVLQSREGGARILEAVRTGAVGHVIAYKLDRLFRDAGDCLRVTSRWDHRGVALHLVDLGGQAIDTRSAMGRFFLTVMAAAAEMERNLIGERTKAALAHKASLGEYVGGRVPFGFQLEPDASKLTKRGDRPIMRLVPDAGEQMTIAAAKELRARGLSLRKVAAALAARGFYARNGRTFDAQQVRSMVLTPV